jgi:hypothetical protein
MAYIPHSSFNGIPFDWAAGSPAKERKNGADYYSGDGYFYTQVDYDNMWSLRAVLNVRAVGDGGNRVYIDSWAPIGTIQYTLAMEGGNQADGSGRTFHESHLAILSDFSSSNRQFRPDPANSSVNVVVLVTVKMEFLILS